MDPSWRHGHPLVLPPVENRRGFMREADYSSSESLAVAKRWIAAFVELHLPGMRSLVSSVFCVSCIFQKDVSDQMNCDGCSGVSELFCS